MPEPIVAIVRIVPQPGKTQAVLDVMADLVPIVHEEDGCLLYTLNVDDASGDIYFVEKWASLEHSERHGRESSILPTLIEKTTPLLTAPPEILNLRPVPYGGEKGAL